MMPGSDNRDTNAARPLFTWQTVCILLGMLAVHALTLLFMGRIAWCECGFGLWTSHAWSSETS
jgi:hypothetical protein